MDINKIIENVKSELNTLKCGAEFLSGYAGNDALILADDIQSSKTYIEDEIYEAYYTGIDEGREDFADTLVHDQSKEINDKFINIVDCKLATIDDDSFNRLVEVFDYWKEKRRK